MKVSNEPIVAGEPIKFIVTGFPEETGLRSSIERFYSLKTDGDRRFLVFNAFDEEIFSGRADEAGKIVDMPASPRPKKS